MSMVEMNVDMDCAGCQSKIKKALLKLDGVEDIEIDMAMQKVTVTGCADQMEVLETVRKTGKRAELWPFPYNPEYQGFINHYNTNYYTQNTNYNNQQVDDDDYKDEGLKNDYYSAHSHKSYDDNNDYHEPYVNVLSYNYREHGYNGHGHGYYAQPPHMAMFEEKSSNLFNDDNPNACSIM